MSSQWKPLSSLKPGQPGVYVDRNREMSAQQRLIEQKKKEIEQKLVDKRRKETGNSGNSDPSGSGGGSKYTKRPGFTAKSSLPDLAQPKVLASADLFANDGSFMEKFLKMQQEMKEKKLEEAQRIESAKETDAQTADVADTKPTAAELQSSFVYTNSAVQNVSETSADVDDSSSNDTAVKQETGDGGPPEMSHGLKTTAPPSFLGTSKMLTSPVADQHGTASAVGGGQSRSPFAAGSSGSEHAQPPGVFPPPPPAPGTGFPGGFLPGFPYPAGPPMAGPPGYPHYPMGYGPPPPPPGAGFFPGPVSGPGIYPPPPPPPPPPPSSSGQSFPGGYGNAGFGPGFEQRPPFGPRFGDPWSVGPRGPPVPPPPPMGKPPANAPGSGPGAPPFMSPGESRAGGPRGPPANVGGPPFGQGNPRMPPGAPPMIPNANLRGPNPGGQFSGDFGPRFPPASQFGPRPPFPGGPECGPYGSNLQNSGPEFGTQKSGNDDYGNRSDNVNDEDDDDDEFDNVQEDDDDYGLRHKQNKRQEYGEDFGRMPGGNPEFNEYGCGGNNGNLQMEDDRYGCDQRRDGSEPRGPGNFAYEGPRSQSPNYRRDHRPRGQSHDQRERQRSRSPYGGRRERSPYGDRRGDQDRDRSSDRYGSSSPDGHCYDRDTMHRLSGNEDFRAVEREGERNEPMWDSKPNANPQFSVPLPTRSVSVPDSGKKKLTVAEAFRDDDNDDNDDDDEDREEGNNRREARGGGQTGTEPP